MGQLKNVGLLKYLVGHKPVWYCTYSVYLLFGCAVNSVTANELHKITFKP